MSDLSVDKLIQMLVKGKDCNNLTIPSDIDDPYVINVILYTAIKYKRYQMVESILSKQLMNALDYIKPVATSITPLFVYAIEKDRPEAVRAFIKYGADVDVVHADKPIQELIVKKFRTSSESILTTPKIAKPKNRTHSITRCYTPLGFEDDIIEPTHFSKSSFSNEQSQPLMQWKGGMRMSMKTVKKACWKGIQIIPDKPLQRKEHSIDKGVDGIDLIRRRRLRFDLVMKHPDFMAIKMLCKAIAYGGMETERRRVEEIAVAAEKYFSITSNITQRVVSKKKWKMFVQRYCDGSDVDETRVMDVIKDCSTLWCFPCGGVSGVDDRRVYLQEYYTKYGITWNEVLSRFESVKNQTEVTVSRYCSALCNILEHLSDNQFDLDDVETQLAGSIKNENVFLLELEAIIKTTNVPAQDVSRICELLLSEKTAEYYILRFLRRLRRLSISSSERASLGTELSEVDTDMSKVKNANRDILNGHPKPQNATVEDIEKCSKILDKISVIKCRCINTSLVHFPEILPKVKMEEQFTSFDINTLPTITSEHLGMTKYELESGSLFLSKTSLDVISKLLYPLHLWGDHNIPHPCIYVSENKVFEFIPSAYIPLIKYCNDAKKKSVDISKLLHQLLSLLLRLSERGFVHGLICLQSLYVYNNRIILLHSGASYSYDYSKSPLSLRGILSDKASSQNDLHAGIRVVQYLSINYPMCIENASDFVDACHALSEGRIGLRDTLFLFRKNDGLVMISESIKGVKKEIRDIEQKIKEIMGKSLFKSADIIKKVYVDKTDKENWEDIENIMNEEFPLKSGGIEALWDTRDDLVNDAEKFVEYTQPPYWELKIPYSNELLFYSENLSNIDPFQVLFNSLTSVGQFKVLGVTRIENSRLWLQYAATRSLVLHSDIKYDVIKTQTQQSDIGKQILTRDINETYLFQGIQSNRIQTTSIHGLTEEDFTEGTCGCGLYFTDDPLMEHHNNCIGNQDSLSVNCMLIVRVVLGKCICAENVSDFLLEDDCDSMFDEVLDGSLEFALYEPRYCYPEYLVTYQCQE